MKDYVSKMKILNEGIITSELSDPDFIDDVSVLEFECSFAFDVDKDPHVDNMDDLLVQLCQVHLHVGLQMLQ